jgi:hypothetical protein
MNNLFICVSTQSDSAWETLLDNSSYVYQLNFFCIKLLNIFNRSNHTQETFAHWLRNISWTPELKRKWQEFYNKGSRRIIIGGANHLETDQEYIIPKYEDLKEEKCLELK